MEKLVPLIAVFFFLGMAHPFYMGVCELHYNEKEQNLQGSVKLFINDLEDALKKLESGPIDLMNVKDSAVTHRALERYLRKRLQLSTNGKKLQYDFIGFEKEEEVIWMYIESKNCPRPSLVEINCSLLYDFLKQQMNIFHVDIGTVKKSLRIKHPETDLKFTF